MSKPFCWVAAITLSLVFFVGLVTLAEKFPLLALVVVGVMVYALVQIAQEAAEL